MEDKSEIKAEVSDTVKEWFTLHQFRTYGDAMGWWLCADYDTTLEAAGILGYSNFVKELMWLTGTFGPLETVDYEMLKPKKKRKKK